MSERRLEVGVALALGATLLVVGASWLQGLRSAQANQVLVEAALGDIAAFAAERVSGELDQLFVALFLDQIAVARRTHYEWRSNGESADPDRGRPLPAGSIPIFFSWSEGAIQTHGSSDPDLERLIGEELPGHLPAYPRPAPYVVLRSVDRHAVVYRHEVDYDRDEEAVFGFIVDFAAFGEWYDGIIRGTTLLPRSVGADADAESLLFATVRLHPDESPLGTWGSPDALGPTAWAFAAKAGRVAVGVTIDEQRALPFTAGGTTAAHFRSLTALGLLALALFGFSLHLVRRAARLSALRERFVANVSHDLRTPITQIRMFSESLRTGRLTSSEDRERALDVIHRQTEVLSDLVSNILLASSERPELQPVDTSLEPLVHEVLDAMEPIASARGTELTVHWSSPGRRGTVDPMAFRRIVTNLVDNALKHARSEDRIVVTVDTNGTLVTVVVEDDGVGVPEEDREAVFERFASRDDNGSGGGAGLGLAVVRDLARRHSGDAWIESAPVDGARVVVRLGAA